MRWKLLRWNERVLSKVGLRLLVPFLLKINSLKNTCFICNILDWIYSEANIDSFQVMKSNIYTEKLKSDLRQKNSWIYLKSIFSNSTDSICKRCPSFPVCRQFSFTSIFTAFLVVEVSTLRQLNFLFFTQKKLDNQQEAKRQKKSEITCRSSGHPPLPIAAECGSGQEKETG